MRKPMVLLVAATACCTATGYIDDSSTGPLEPLTEQPPSAEPEEPVEPPDPCEADPGPTIELQPQSSGHCRGESTTFTVLASGYGDLTYRWSKDGIPLTDGDTLTGAETSLLTLFDADATDDGAYTVEVTDACGARVVSEEATLTWVDPCLAVHPNGHFFSYRGEPVMLVGDSGTQVVMQNANIDYREWIDHCAERGIRAVHVWSFVAPRQKKDGSKKEARYGYIYPGITPWPRKGGSSTDGFGKWNVQSYDEGNDGQLKKYWPRMRDLWRYAQERDIIVGVSVYFGWPKGDDNFLYHPLADRNGGFLEDDEWEDTATIATSSEVHTASYNFDWSEAKKTQWVWERLGIKFINEAKAFNNVFFVFMDERSYPNNGDVPSLTVSHFRKFFRNRGALWLDENAERGNVDAVVEKIRNNDKNATTVNYFKKTPARPIFNLEAGPYRGSGLRTGIWTMAIGGGQYFFHADADQEHVRMGIMGFDPNVNVPDGLADDRYGSTKRDWLGHASRFFNEHLLDLASLRPRNGKVSSGSYCFADLGREYAVYSKSGATVDVDLSDGAGTFEYYFFNPRTGESTERAEVEGGATRTFTKPGTNDWALHIARID